MKRVNVRLSKELMRGLFFLVAKKEKDESRWTNFQQKENVFALVGLIKGVFRRRSTCLLQQGHYQRIAPSNPCPSHYIPLSPSSSASRIDARLSPLPNNSSLIRCILKASIPLIYPLSKKKITDD